MASLGAHAQAEADADWRHDGERAPKWELGVGVGGLSTPAYRGSSVQKGYGLVYPYFIYRGDRVRADRNGLRTWLWRNEGASIDLSLAAAVPVRDVPAREGMDNLSPVLELGPVLKVPLNAAAQANHSRPTDLPSHDGAATAPGGVQWAFHLPLRQAYRLSRSAGIRDIGLVAAPGLQVQGNLRLGQQTWRWSGAASAYIGQARYHAHYYDVQASQVRVDRAEYHAPGGYGGWALSGGLQHRFAQQSLGLFARVSSVQGSVFAQSPLVQQNRNYALGLMWTWVFSNSNEVR
jgi:MipA family protein